MDSDRYLDRIRDDESLLGDLEDDTAQLVLDWLLGVAETILGQATSEAEADRRVAELKKQGGWLAKAIVAQCETKDREATQESLKALGIKLPSGGSATLPTESVEFAQWLIQRIEERTDA